MSAKVRVTNLTMSYGSHVVLRDLNFEVQAHEIFVIMGDSGCGKSTLLRHLVGLHEPVNGAIFYNEVNFTATSPEQRQTVTKNFGVLDPYTTLQSSLTLGENVALPLEERGSLPAKTIRDLVAYKLALVGLSSYANYYPSQISGGMKKRAGLARALALDPNILFLDEPGAGLDPLSSHCLDELILRLRDSLGLTVILFTHELASILSVADKALFLDTTTRSQAAFGHPRELHEHSDHPGVRLFLNRDTLPESPS